MIYSRMKNKLEGNGNGLRPINEFGGRRSLWMIVPRKGVFSTAIYKCLALLSKYIGFNSRRWSKRAQSVFQRKYDDKFCKVEIDEKYSKADVLYNYTSLSH